jgi:hypothetical protein
MPTIQSAQAKLRRKLERVTEREYCDPQIQMGRPQADCTEQYRKWHSKIDQIVNDWAEGYQGR